MSNETSVESEEQDGTVYTKTTLSDFQVILVYVCMSLSASLSLMGSLGIITVARRKLKSYNRVYQRLMIFMSSSDVMLSLVLIAGRLMVPSSTGDPLALGNTVTCTILGVFVLITGLATCILCSYLSFYFLLTTKYGWREREISSKLEKPAYALAFFIVATYVSCTAGVGTLHANPNAGLCTGYGSGPKYDAVMWIYTFLLTIFAGGGCYATYQVYRHVYLVTQQSRTHDQSFGVSASIPSSSAHERHRQQEDQRQARVRRVARQAIAYYVALLNTLFWPTLYNLLVQYSDVDIRAHEPFFYVMAFGGFILYPLQGFFNFVIYIQFRVKTWKRVRPHISWLRATWWAVTKPNDPPTHVNSNFANTSTHSANSSIASQLRDASSAFWSMSGARRVSQMLLSLPYSSSGQPGSHQGDNNNDNDDLDLGDLSSSSSSEDEFATDSKGQLLPWWQQQSKVPTAIEHSNGTPHEEDTEDATRTRRKPVYAPQKEGHPTGGLDKEEDIEAPQEPGSVGTSTNVNRPAEVNGADINDGTLHVFATVTERTMDRSSPAAEDDSRVQQVDHEASSHSLSKDTSHDKGTAIAISLVEVGSADQDGLAGAAMVKDTERDSKNEARQLVEDSTPETRDVVFEKERDTIVEAAKGVVTSATPDGQASEIEMKAKQHPIVKPGQEQHGETATDAAAGFEKKGDHMVEATQGPVGDTTSVSAERALQEETMSDTSKQFQTEIPEKLRNGCVQTRQAPDRHYQLPSEPGADNCHKSVEPPLPKQRLQPAPQALSSDNFQTSEKHLQEIESLSNWISKWEGPLNQTNK